MGNAEGAMPSEQIDIDVIEVDTVLPDGTAIEEIDIKETIVERPGHGHGHTAIVVIVNEDHHVELPSSEVTGLQIKEAAIATGARITVDFKLSILFPDDSTQVVGDHERIRVHMGEKFVAVHDDVNS